MKALLRSTAVVLALAGMVLGSVVPSYAAGRGGGHGHAGSGHNGGRHSPSPGSHGIHHHGRCWWFCPAIVVGSVAVAYPYYYPTYPVYSPVVEEQPMPAVGQSAVAYQEASPIQRDVVYPHGKYVLYGDGVTEPWQWVWIPAVPAQ